MGWLRGESDHFPIFLELKGASRKPGSPFKFNSSWLKDQTYNSLIRETWRQHFRSQGYSLAQSFMENLKRLKLTTISWAREKKLRDEYVLKNIEIELEELECLEGDGYEIEEKKERIKIMEGERRGIPKDIEE